MNKLFQLGVLKSVLSVLMLSSCAPSQYYQLHKTEVAEDMKVNDNHVIYEDENCSVAYDLWSAGGDAGFWFRNDSDEDIHLHLNKSYFVKNGVAYDYYLDRVYESSSQSSVSTRGRKGAIGVASSSQRGHAQKEQEVVTIPANTRKKISEYPVSLFRVTHCDLPGYPSRLNIQTKAYDKQNSPVVFSNRLSYSFADNPELISFENEFYVSEVTNIPERDMYEMRSVTVCGRRVGNRRFMRHVRPDSYYLKYQR